MRRMVCIRKCHGFRGGLWEKGEVVDAADGEDVPRHFIPEDEYDDFVDNENSLRVKVDPMKVSPQLSPVPRHLQNTGGMTSSKMGKITTASVGGNKPGQDI